MIKKQKNDPELQAIDVILSALNVVPKERQGAVIAYIEQRLQLAVTHDNTQLQLGAIPNFAPDKPVGKVPKSIAEFVKIKKPQNSYQSAAVLAYYLQNFENMGEFEPKDIEQANVRAKSSKMSNVPQTLIDAENKNGLFTEGAVDSKKRQLTTKGEDVVEALPEQEKVKLILAQNKFRKSSKSKKRKVK